MTKEERRDWLNARLDETTKEFGRASKIANTIDVSHAVAVGWLKGSLPRDIETAFKFCDTFGIDLREWATGERKNVVSSEKARKRNFELIKLTREFEAHLGFELSMDQFEMIYDLIDEETVDGSINMVSKMQKWGKVLQLTNKK